MKLKFRIFQCLPFYPSTQSLLLLFEPSRPPGEVGGGSAANKQWLRTKLHELTKKKTSMIFANYSQEASLRPLFHFVLATLLWSKCLTNDWVYFVPGPQRAAEQSDPAIFRGCYHTVEFAFQGQYDCSWHASAASPQQSSESESVFQRRWWRIRKGGEDDPQWLADVLDAASIGQKDKDEDFFHSELFSSPLWCSGWIPACLPVEGYRFDSLKSLASGRACFFSAFGSEMLTWWESFWNCEFVQLLL